MKAYQSASKTTAESCSEDCIIHYGTKYHSGRYPWGSGENPYQHGSYPFATAVQEMRDDGYSDEQIRKAMGLNTAEWRREVAIAKDTKTAMLIDKAKSMKDDGLSNSEIARKLGVVEGTVRYWFNSDAERRAKLSKNTADFLKKQVDEKKYIDIGSTIELELGVTKEKLEEATRMLSAEGYTVDTVRIPQPTNPGQKTTMKILIAPGGDIKEVYRNADIVKTITEYTSDDDGQTFRKMVYPKSMDSKRLQICYAEDGGIQKDGLVEIRPGCDDLSLGNDRYAQVRILVDGSHYIKGMAVYNDDLPKGVDVRFNTNKSKDVAKLDVLKPIKNDDPVNPFGAAIKPNGQSYYTDENGKEQLSLINKRASEGDWSEWKDTVPSQFLSKQSLQLARKQLGIKTSETDAEFKEIMSITNPTLKKHYLKKFADSCDGAAVDLKAAALPGQKYNVIIPLNNVKDDEIVAPGYADGTKLALVRYPHGGKFEIPIVTVNNSYIKRKKVVMESDWKDAVGINMNVASQLSGADFDGDTVMCIPTDTGHVKIQSKKPLKQLANFDPKMEYGGTKAIRKTKAGDVEVYERNGVAYNTMKKGSVQKEMGTISNLITDMTLLGAPDDQIARAVKHSMVVIDAYKHHLDYKSSETDNGIDALKRQWQIKPDGGYGGASTLISRASAKEYINKRQGTPKTNIPGKSWYDPSRPEGALIYKEAPEQAFKNVSIDKKTNEKVWTTVYKKAQDTSTKMAETDDARTLLSAHGGTVMENIYADYANSMKDYARKARLAYADTGRLAYSPEASKQYAPEVASIDKKLTAALLNKGRERAAIRKSYAIVQERQKAYKEAHEGQKMAKKDLKKIAQKAITESRYDVGSVSRSERAIKLTDREWEAIQAGAIHDNKLASILDNADTDELRSRSLPKTKRGVSAVKMSMAKRMAANGYTLGEIAAKIGVSTSTVSNILSGKEE